MLRPSSAPALVTGLATDRPGRTPSWVAPWERGPLARPGLGLARGGHPAGAACAAGQSERPAGMASPVPSNTGDGRDARAPSGSSPTALVPAMTLRWSGNRYLRLCVVLVGAQ